MPDRLADIGEKGLIRQVLSEFAVTARRGYIDDCVVIDLSEVTGVSELPYLVYSVDTCSTTSRFPCGTVTMSSVISKLCGNV